MKKILIITLLLFPVLSFSQEKNECEERSMPYWANGINSRIKGESATFRKAFKDVQLSETDINPANGFITLRLNISKSGKLCDIESFEIDEHYKNTEFNNGELVAQLKNIARDLKGWSRDRDLKTYNLIRITVKNGKIDEIF